MDDRWRVKVEADAVVVPGPEWIVRALAALESNDLESGCNLCYELGDHRFGMGYRVEEHNPACPWRLAREWVAANPA